MGHADFALPEGAENIAYGESYWGSETILSGGCAIGRPLIVDNKRTRCGDQGDLLNYVCEKMEEYKPIIEKEAEISEEAVRFVDGKLDGYEFTRKGQLERFLPLKALAQSP